MNKDELEKRLLELKRTLEQIQANGNATVGAINECEFWLRKIEAEEVKNENQTT